MKETTGTFADIYYMLAQEGEEAEVIIGGVDMPATLVCDDTVDFTDFAYEEFGDVLNAPAELRRAADKFSFNLIEVDCVDYEMGERLVYALAGYISESQYKKLFQEEK